jgi:hypothetical protein
MAEESEPAVERPNDPTKDPAFQRVVQTFLNTPPKPKEGKAGPDRRLDKLKKTR